MPVTNETDGDPEVPSGIYIARVPAPQEAGLVPPALGVPATGSPAGVTPEYSKSIKMLSSRRMRECC